MKKVKETKLKLENFEIAKLSNSHLIVGGNGGGDVSDNDPLKPTKCVKGSTIVVNPDGTPIK